MKRILIVSICFLLASVFVFQSNGFGKSRLDQEKKFCCTQCHSCSEKAGSCKHDKSEMVREGDYYCSSCKTQGAKAGKCSKCGKEMSKMVCSADKKSKGHMGKHHSEDKK